MTQWVMCTYFDKLELIFSQYRKIQIPLCSTLALIAIHQPTALGLQTGGHSRANRRGKKKKKFQLVKPGAQLSIVYHHVQFCKQFRINQQRGGWKTVHVIGFNSSITIFIVGCWGLVESAARGLYTRFSLVCPTAV